jgi:hypothetical protein
VNHLKEVVGRILEELSKLEPTMVRYAETVEEISRLLNTTVFRIDTTALVTPARLEAELKVGRPLRVPEFAPLRCEEDRDYVLTRVKLRCWRTCEITLRIVKVEEYESPHPYESPRTYYLSGLELADLLALACNITPEELGQLIGRIEDGVGELVRDLARLREILAYARLTE